MYQKFVLRIKFHLKLERCWVSWIVFETQSVPRSKHFKDTKTIT